MVQLPNTWELAMLYLAITRTGALISPMPMQWRFSELDFIAGMTDAKRQDYQAGYEKGMTIAMSALAGVNMICESAGMMGRRSI